MYRLGEGGEELSGVTGRGGCEQIARKQAGQNPGDGRAFFEEKSLEAFEAKCGIKPVTLSGNDQKKLETAAVNVREKLTGKVYDRDLLNDIQQALAEYRSR